MQWLKKMFRWLWRFIRALGPLRLLFGLLLLGLIMADLYCEVYGLPEEGMNAVRASLFARGFRVEIRELRAGLLYGLRADGVELWDGQRADVKMAEARSVRVKFRVAPLLRGRFRPTDVDVSGLEILPPAAPGPAQHAPVLPLVRLDFLCHLGARDITLSALEGNLAGIRLHGSGRVRDLTEQQLGRTRFTMGGFGWEALLAGQRETVVGAIRQVTEAVAANGIPSAEGLVDFRFECPAGQPQELNSWGAFALSDVRVRDTELRKLHGKFAYRQQRLHLEELFLQVLGDQSARATVDYDFARRLVSAKVSGILDPQLAFRLAGRVAPRFFTELKLGTPLTFAADLQPSPPDPARLRGTLACQGAGIWYRELGVGRAQSQFTFNAGTVALDSLLLEKLSWNDLNVESIEAAATGNRSKVEVSRLAVTVDAASGEKISGTVTLFPETNAYACAAELKGFLLPKTLVRALPHLNAATRQLADDFAFTGGPPDFSCRLERLTLAELSGTLTIAAKQFTFRDLVVSESRVQGSLKGGVIDAQAQVTLGDPAPGQMTVAARYTPADQMLSGTLEASLHPDRIHKRLRLPAHPAVSRFAFHGGPATLKLELKPSPPDPRQWRGTGTFAATDASYETLDIKQLSCRLAMAPGTLSFDAVHGITQKKEELDGSVKVFLPDGDVEVRGTVKGPPMFAEVFVAPGRFRERFRAIWAGLKWDPEQPPLITLERLFYTNNYGTRPWRFEMKSHFDVHNLEYKGFKADHVVLDFNMDLPTRIDIANARVKLGKAEAAGGVSMELEDMASCQFSFTAASDPRLILRIINADWDRYFANVRFAEDTAVVCEGSFFFGQEPRTRLRGSLKSGPGAYQKIQFTEFDCKWLLDGTRLSWSPVTARIYGGTVASTGVFDFDSDAGQLGLAVERVALEDLTGALGMPKSKQVDGKLSGNVRLDLLRPKPEDPIAITGGGRTWITQGDLWNLPFFNTLGELVGMTSLGKITRLDAVLDFAGKHLQVSEFHTDGTLLALHGAGDYNWTDELVDFTVRGEALKNTQIVPILLKPLFWFFEAELKGKFKEARWRLARSHGDDESP